MTDSTKIATEKTQRPKGKPRGRPIQKGQVLNPHGRPKRGQSIAEKLRELSDPTIVAMTIIEMAIGDRDPRAMAMLLDRTEGKVADMVINLTESFQESDRILDRDITWLTKHHPKLVSEWRKIHGIQLD